MALLERTPVRPSLAAETAFFLLYWGGFPRPNVKGKSSLGSETIDYRGAGAALYNLWRD